MNASLPRIGATPGSRPIISNSKLSASGSPRNFGSGLSSVIRNVRAFSFCCSGVISFSFACRSAADDQHRARGMPDHSFGRAAEQHRVCVGAAMGRHHDQVDAIFARVVTNLDCGRSNDGGGGYLLRILEGVLLDATELL